jgi:hypothetical protein
LPIVRETLLRAFRKVGRPVRFRQQYPYWAAEVFSATHPRSNQKLHKDIARLASDPARQRYVFFAAPGYAPGRQPQLEEPGTGVHVYATEP